MCGIVGIINKSNKPVNENDIKKMCSTIIHRGPDDEGVFVNDAIGIGMRRLNIIDLQTGRQPIHNEDKSVWVVFNGEIYNFKELREYLIKKGHRFYTRSDTEVIIHMYEQEGEKCLQKFNGMFAFAIYDLRKNKIFIARDRLGIKPLFYYENNDKILFASEIKAMLIFDSLKREINWRAFNAFFTLSYIPSPMTIFKGIFKLDPGHYMVVKNKKIKIKKYWDICFEPKTDMNEKKIAERFLELFEDSVRMRMMSDVPLGAFLSGGIDSSAVVAMMSRYNGSVETLSIGFGGDIGAYDDERKYARSVSEKYRTIHREYEIKPSDFDSSLIEKIVRAFDEPFADHGVIPNYFVCKMAKENMTVALSGLGGDENFSGYPRYLGFYLGELYNKFIPEILRAKIFPRIVESLPESRGGEVTINWIKRFIRSGGLPDAERYLNYVNLLSSYPSNTLFSKDVRKIIENQNYSLDYLSKYHTENAQISMDKVYYTDIKTYLPDDILALTDRISMLHSLEVRVPFLDHRLMEFCATIPHQLKMKYFQPKYFLKQATSHLLPKEVIKHKKQGFVAPMSLWLNNELRDYAHDVLLSKPKAPEFFDNKAIAEVLRQHFNGEQLNTSKIWALLIFKIWYGIYVNV